MLVRVTPPEPFVSVVEARTRLRLDAIEDDADIQAMIAAATGWIDGAEGWLGRALNPQTWELRLDGGWLYSCPWYGWRGNQQGFRLPLPPLISVESVTYKDADGASQTFASGSYVVSGVGGFGLVSLASGASWPALYSGPEALTIRFRAGYVDGVPEPVRQAVLLLVGHFYESRLAAGPQQGPAPFGVDALLAPFRVWS